MLVIQKLLEIMKKIKKQVFLNFLKSIKGVKKNMFFNNDKPCFFKLFIC